MEDNCGWMEARYYAALDDWILDPVSRRIIQEMRRPMEDLRGYVGRRGRPVQKIQSYFRDEATQRAVLAALAEEFPELSVACSLPGNVELTHRDATKGAAMTALCAHLGIPLERAVAFGDERNDLSLIHIFFCQHEGGMKIISEQLQRYSNTHTAWSGDDRDAVTMLQAFLGSGGKSVRGSRLKTHGLIRMGRLN